VRRVELTGSKLLPGRSGRVQVFGRRRQRSLRVHGQPASKKRQGTKSRSAGQRLGGEGYGDFRLAPHSMLARHRGGGARIAARGGWRERGRSVPSGVWRVPPDAGRMDCPESG
jgi:hypothetical protein